MTTDIVIEDLAAEGIEMAERKGIGHPDTICDHVTEQISIALCKYYLDEFGAIMHHNVDKALLIAGQSMPAYRGGKIIKPISLILAGSATYQVKDRKVPVEEIAIEVAKKWLGENIRHIDVAKEVHVISKIHRGSEDLVELFNRFGKGEVPLANDTSFGVGYYPTTPMEDRIIEIEELLNAGSTKFTFPFIGEDIKVMGVKTYSGNYFTISIAMIDKYIVDINDYITKIKQIKIFLYTRLSLSDSTIYINTADDYGRESIYLTVSGTSGENGDDGQVGRGNRINGLITPYQPMSLEATAGKNPVSHIGKIYNYFAMDVSRAIVENHFAEAANVFIVSQIGKPINAPQLFHFKLKNMSVDKKQIEDLAKEKLNGLHRYWKRIINV